MAKVTIKPLGASLTHNVAVFRMKPYVKVSLGYQLEETQADSEGGKNPHWHNTIELRRHNHNEVLKFLVFDYNKFGSDKLIGKASFDFRSMNGHHRFDGWIPLLHHANDAGDLHVEISIDHHPHHHNHQPAYPPQIHIKLPRYTNEQTLAHGILIVEARAMWIQRGANIMAGQNPYPQRPPSSMLSSNLSSPRVSSHQSSRQPSSPSAQSDEDSYSRFNYSP